jgi:hypothetical protein
MVFQLFLKNFIRLFFFSNHFYGVCAVALSMEAGLNQGYDLNSFLLYLLIYACTVAYYTQASLQTEFSEHTPNSRSQWYSQHKKILLNTQYFLYGIIFICLTWILVRSWSHLLHFTTFEWLVTFLFPVVAFFYYGIEIKFFGRYNLRTIGWLKPFVIGFTWAGLVTIYPILYSNNIHSEHYSLQLAGGFLFINNFMYITILSILFDIKDYAMDHNAQVKTIVLKLGLRKTLFYFLLPLCFLGLTSLFMYDYFQHFSILKIVLNTIPFLFIISVIYSLSNRRSIFYYLIIIDGLMLVKAVCGIIASIYF